MRPLWAAWSALAVVACGVLAYGNSFDVPFVFDDLDNVANNSHLRIERLGWAELRQAERASQSSSRPVSNASFAVDRYFGGASVFGDHAVNLAIHLANGILVLLLFRERSRGWPRRIAFPTLAAAAATACVAFLYLGAAADRVASRFSRAR